MWGVFEASVCARNIVFNCRLHNGHVISWANIAYVCYVRLLKVEKGTFFLKERGSENYLCRWAWGWVHASFIRLSREGEWVQVGYFLTYAFASTSSSVWPGATLGGEPLLVSIPRQYPLLVISFEVFLFLRLYILALSV